MQFLTYKKKYTNDLNEEQRIFSIHVELIIDFFHLKIISMKEMSVILQLFLLQ